MQLFNSVQKWCAKPDKTSMNIRNICFNPRQVAEESDEEEEEEEEEEEGVQAFMRMEAMEHSRYAAADYLSRSARNLSAINSEDNM